MPPGQDRATRACDREAVTTNGHEGDRRPERCAPDGGGGPPTGSCSKDADSPGPGETDHVRQQSGCPAPRQSREPLAPTTGGHAASGHARAHGPPGLCQHASGELHKANRPAPGPGVGRGCRWHCWHWLSSCGGRVHTLGGQTPEVGFAGLASGCQRDALPAEALGTPSGPSHGLAAAGIPWRAGHRVRQRSPGKRINRTWPHSEPFIVTSQST